MYKTGDLQLDRLVDNPGLVPMQYAANTAKEMIVTAELLAGRATQCVDRSRSFASTTGNNS
jgi:hypothetical protein